ncbi:uncharacterized protein FFFS_15703 [Fusarium fujikuroi]|nr:uncharacterized protein FFFS_15703 [Fusarium fujikuroi]
MAQDDGGEWLDQTHSCEKIDCMP